MKNKIKIVSTILSLTILLNLTMLPSFAQTDEVIKPSFSIENVNMLVEQGVSYRGVLELYFQQGVITNRELQQLLEYDEQFLAQFSISLDDPINIMQINSISDTETINISINTLFTGTVTVATIALAIANVLNTPAAICMAVAEFVFSLWSDNIPFQGITIEYYWQEYYDDNIGQTRRICHIVDYWTY